MRYLGITFAPTVWGFLAAVSEFFGGMALAAGGLLRPAAFFLVCTMTVATVQHFGRGDGYAGGAFHSIEMGVACLSLLLMGPGRFSLGEVAKAALRRKRDRR
jgi:putative oxidoreductase